jgi:pyridoxamine 5'-phosphate oxidase
VEAPTPAVLERERSRHWRALTPAGRALWGWPPPGEPCDPARTAPAPEAFPAALDEQAPLPEHFLLLRIALAQVELLELGGHPHRRRRWRAEADWAEAWLNP